MVLWAIPIVFAVMSIAVPFLLAPMVAFDLVLLLVLVVDLAASGAKVEVARTVAPVQAVGRPVPIELLVMNRSKRRLAVQVVDTPPQADPSPVLTLDVPGGQAVETSYQGVIERRGLHGFGPITVRWTSPLGLWQRQRREHQTDEIRVYPDFAQLRTWGMDARIGEERAPVRARRRPGGENDFQRLRPYVPGDPYRHIDWRATARKGEFVTREFGQEANQNVIFLLDAGRMMSADHGGLTAFDHALNAALMMSQVALQHGDRVGLLAFDNTIRTWLPPKGGKRSGSRMIRATYDLFPSLGEPDYAAAFRHLSTRVRRRSLVVLITAVVDDVNAQLASNLVRGLHSRHLPMAVWLRDPAVDAFLEQPVAAPLDPWLRTAAAEIALGRERSLSGLRRKGALVVDASVSELTPALLSQYLEVKARRLL